MYLSELLAALARRWWLVVLGLLATAALCVAAYTLVPPEDEIHATMLVLPPETTVEVVHNPLLALGDLPPAADVLARAMNSGDVADALVPPGSTGEYSVVRDTSTSGPVLAITATDQTAEKAEALLEAVVQRMPQEFASLQSAIEVSDSSAMKVTLLARETTSTESKKSQVRAVLIAALGGLAVTVFGVSLLDGLLRRRSENRRQSRRKSVAVSQPEPPVEPAERPAVPAAPADPQVPVASGEAHRDGAETNGAVVVPRRVMTVTPRGRSDTESFEETRPT